MKHIYTTLLFLFIGSCAFSQERSNFDNEFQTVKSELTNWDPIRGEWLASSLKAMAFDEAIPDRTFPEDFTPYQVFSMVPEQIQNNVVQQANQRRPSSNYNSQWSSIQRYVSSTNCESRKGRSYGDPHLISFDGARFSFQTVGEFVLAKSVQRNIEVQVRQRQQNDAFSLNSGVAMNVNGDRLCIYADDYPDADYSTPIRLNGMSVHLTNAIYFLPHGGTLMKSGQTYTVYFPNGEVVNTKIRKSGSSDFIDVSVIILPCSTNDFSGLLGNANGSTRDDFEVPGRISPPIYVSTRSDEDYFKKERQAFLQKDFAEVHRVTMATTLFDYPPGMSTASYTNRMYPIVHRTLRDINQRQLERSRQLCRERGVNSLDMNGCVFDNSYLNIPPSRPTVVRDPTNGTVFRPVSHTRPNVNPVSPVRPKPHSKPAFNNHQINTKPSTSPRPTPVSKPKPRPVYKPTSRPVSRPVSKPKPKPVYRPSSKPKPRPVSKPRPRPTPKPKPVVKSRPGGRG